MASPSVLNAAVNSSRKTNSVTTAGLSSMGHSEWVVEMANYEDLTAEARHAAAIEAQEYNLAATLKPAIMIDGNQWCVLWGENLQDGVAGFGDTPYLAILDFNKAFHKPLANSPSTGTQP